MSSLKLQIGLKIHYFLCLVAVYSFHCMFYSINLSSLISEPYFHREDWDSFMLNIQPAGCLEWEVSEFYLAAIRTQNYSLWLHVYYWITEYIKRDLFLVRIKSFQLFWDINKHKLCILFSFKNVFSLQK